MYKVVWTCCDLWPSLTQKARKLFNEKSWEPLSFLWLSMKRMKWLLHTFPCSFPLIYCNIMKFAFAIGNTNERLGYSHHGVHRIAIIHFHNISFNIQFYSPLSFTRKTSDDGNETFTLLHELETQGKHFSIYFSLHYNSLWLQTVRSTYKKIASKKYNLCGKLKLEIHWRYLTMNDMNKFTNPLTENFENFTCSTLQSPSSINSITASTVMLSADIK